MHTHLFLFPLSLYRTLIIPYGIPLSGVHVMQYAYYAVCRFFFLSYICWPIRLRNVGLTHSGTLLGVPTVSDRL